MKIRRVNFQGHAVLGNLNLDFTDPLTGEAFHTIILAGENGSGKTLILGELYSTLGEFDLNKQSGAIEIELDIDQSTLAIMATKLNIPNLTVQDNRVTVRQEYKGRGTWDSIVFSFKDETGVLVQRQSHDYLMPQNSLRPFRLFFNEAEVDFRVAALDAVRATGLDDGVPARRSGGELARQISQLLIDIRAADNEDIAVWMESHPGAPLDEGALDRRMSRFKDAMAYMFPAKRFKTVARIDNKYRVEFEEHGKVTTLDQLSTGEKQIIFRGGFVLRDLSGIRGGVVLVDEPELSLHPNWQARVLGFYQRLLPQTSESTTQLIMATHSPFVVHEQANAKVIILRRNQETGGIEVDPEPSYPTTGHARVIRALNIESLIARTEHSIVVLVEGETDKTILETAWGKLFPGAQRYCEIRAALSDAAIRTTLNDGQIFTKNPSKKLIGIFDFDDSYAQWKGTWNKTNILVVSDDTRSLVRKHQTEAGWSMLLPVPPFRRELASVALGSDSALSIELLFKDEDHLAGMIDSLPLPAIGATKPKMKDAMKVPFADHVKNLPAESFVAFKPVFERLEDIRNGTI